MEPRIGNKKPIVAITKEVVFDSFLFSHLLKLNLQL